MDGEVTEDTASVANNPHRDKPSEEKTSYAEALRFFAQLAIHIGMSRDEYWNQDPYIMEEYLGAYKMRREEENWQAWIGGIYTFDAVSAVIGNIHFDKGSHSIVKPMEKPMPIFPETPEEIARKRQAAIDRFVAGLESIHVTRTEQDNAE